jgi:insulysin
LEVEARIEAFLSGFAATLAAMDEPEFERHRAALIAAKQQRERNLAEEADRHWEQIFNRRYDFAVREEEVACLRTLKPEQLRVSWGRVLGGSEG